LIGAGALYLLGTFIFARSYSTDGANTGAKCIGRLMMRSTLWVMGGLALLSAAVLIKETYKLEMPKALSSFLPGRK